MQRLFSLELPFSRFAWNTLVVSLAGLLPLLVLFIAMTPDLAGHLAGGGPALSRFVRQVLTNGVPVVFVVNYVAFFLYASTNARGNHERRPGSVLFLDVAARLVAFIVLHILIYVLSADWFGSFGGSRATAVRVVAPTLARSAFFENISGVYLYATLVSALPLYGTAIENSGTLGRLARRFPGRSGSLVIATAFFAVSVLALTAFSALLVWWQTP